MSNFAVIISWNLTILDAIPLLQSSELTRPLFLPVAINGYMLYSVESQLFMKQEIA